MGFSVLNAINSIQMFFLTLAEFLWLLFIGCDSLVLKKDSLVSNYLELYSLAPISPCVLGILKEESLSILLNPEAIRSSYGFPYKS